jgi:CheY-like chemotaxis protein
MSPSQRRFLLHIEDDEDDQAMLKEAIKETEAAPEVWTARNGQEGLEILRQCVLLNNLPSLIILDLNLPGMDGKKVLMEIKKHPVLSLIPVAIFTTSSSQLDKLFAEKHHVELITKPSSEVDFFQSVKNILENCYRTSK